jgi:pyridoxal phosphate enzyme (YggS family)
VATPPDPIDVDPRDVAAFERARASVLARIATACQTTGRDPDDVMLVAVSKTVPVDRLAAAVAAGLTTLGENRVQEAADKVPAVPDATWHLIGPLQSNKARRAVELFDVIQSVDSVDLGLRLDRLAGEARGALPVLLQVNVDDDPAKAGFARADLPAALEGLGRCDALRVDGLMTIGRLVAEPEQARTTFRRLRVASEALRSAGYPLGPALSMGMSDDYPIAVEEGATMVRVGRALFGERHDHDHDLGPGHAH